MFNTVVRSVILNKILRTVQEFHICVDFKTRFCIIHIIERLLTERDTDMAILKYARVSSKGQNLDRQLVGEYDKLFTDKISGSTVHRSGLDELIAYMREGDTVLIDHTDRLTRKGVSAMEEHLAVFREAGVSVKFGNLAETIHADKPISSQDAFLLDIMASLDKQQRTKIKEVAALGIKVAKEKDAIAKKEGRLEDVKYKGRRPSVEVGKLRKAIKDTKHYPNLILQTEAVNRDYMKISKSRLHKEVVAMRKEGIL